ncbi:uncharacterized protein [Pyxicephalus adspersus]|uniref:uncharacterized protein n=1 Tax=Pyxicephalus adspersus TaxID=30357 RepID=UPI003B58BA0D
MCTISHPSLERPIERRSGPLQVQAKPKVKKAMKLSLGTGEVIFTQILENFYPKDIQIRWCYWSGKKLEQYLPSEEKYQPDLYKTFTVTSVCKVPEDLLHNINFKVRVTWRHKSMDEAEYKEMSIKDKEFPWKPNLELSVPPLRIGEEATIQSKITKYLPDAVTVTWLRKEIQSGEMYPLSSDGIYRITDTPLGKQKDKLYGYNSSVTFSSSMERDDGVEYICRVEHPSLEQPIEKSTGDLYVSAPESQNSDIQGDMTTSATPSNLNLGAPIPESHHSPAQDVSYMMAYQHNPGVLVPESYHPPPENESYIIDGQNHSCVPVPELYHPAQEDESDLMECENNSCVPVPESYHPALEDDSDLMECENQSGVQDPVESTMMT